MSNSHKLLEVKYDKKNFTTTSYTGVGTDGITYVMYVPTNDGKYIVNFFAYNQKFSDGTLKAVERVTLCKGNTVCREAVFYTNTKAGTDFTEEGIYTDCSNKVKFIVDSTDIRTLQFYSNICSFKHMFIQTYVYNSSLLNVKIS